MRRIMENVMITLPVGLLLFIPIAMGLNEIYPWTNQQAVAADAVLQAKSSLSDAELVSSAARLFTSFCGRYGRVRSIISRPSRTPRGL